MFTFEQRDEGLLAVRVSDGKPVANIDTRKVGVTSDPNLRAQKKTVTALPRDRWQVHFTAARLSPDEVLAFGQAIPPSDVRGDETK